MLYKVNQQDPHKPSAEKVGGALRMRKHRQKVLSSGELEKNGFSIFERAHDILSKGVFKNWEKLFLCLPWVGPKR